jgi:[ribosomal protein S5]-alanine N-acetyltransferase
MVDVIRTEHLVLRPMSAGDRAEFVRIHTRGHDHFRPWLPKPPDGESAEQAFERELERSEGGHAAGTSERRVGFIADGRMAGIFGLSQIFRGPFLNCYAGWRVAADCLGRGLATEGVLALLDLAFAPEPFGLGLHRVQANVIPNNAPSLRVAEKVGFRREGLALRYLEIDGRWQDHVMFAKTAEEHTLRYLRG